MEKLQSFIDAAALAVQPIEEDPVKKKKLAKQCDHRHVFLLLWTTRTTQYS